MFEMVEPLVSSFLKDLYSVYDTMWTWGGNIVFRVRKLLGAILWPLKELLLDLLDILVTDLFKFAELIVDWVLTPLVHYFEWIKSGIHTVATHVQVLFEGFLAVFSECFER